MPDVIRRNILADPISMQKFTRGVNLLKADFSAGLTTTSLGFGGPAVPVSAYDQFVLWHSAAMSLETPPGSASGRNAAHRGPTFLPWHRFMLLMFESHLQRVLEDPDFGLPYWDWAADGDLEPTAQPDSPLWQDTGLGGSGQPVTDGPFAFDADDPKGFRVLFSEDVLSGQLVVLMQTRGLFRQIAQAGGYEDLPTSAEVTSTLTEDVYDEADWDAEAGTAGFRNFVEGWVRNSGGEVTMHNRVHVWISGDMGPSTSPNDPAFFLNHCNVDRIWEAWMAVHGRSYLPADGEPGAPEGHRLSDAITSLVTTLTTTPAQMLDVAHLYTYDSLPA